MYYKAYNPYQTFKFSIQLFYQFLNQLHIIGFSHFLTACSVVGRWLIPTSNNVQPRIHSSQTKDLEFNALIRSIYLFPLTSKHIKCLYVLTHFLHYKIEYVRM